MCFTGKPLSGYRTALAPISVSLCADIHIIMSRAGRYGALARFKINTGRHDYQISERIIAQIAVFVNPCGGSENCFSDSF